MRHLFRLGGAVGNDRDNRPEDVRAVKTALRRLGYYDTPSYRSTEWLDRETVDGLKRLQRDRGLAPDGWLRPGGPTHNALARPSELPTGTELQGASRPVSGRLVLEGPVGDGAESRAGDVRHVKEALLQLGLYDDVDAHEPGPAVTRGLVDGIKTLQHELGLKEDGRLVPGGETETAINGALQTLVYRPEEDNKGAFVPLPHRPEESGGTPAYTRYRSDGEPRFMLASIAAGKGLTGAARGAGLELPPEIERGGRKLMRRTPPGRAVAVIGLLEQLRRERMESFGIAGEAAKPSPHATPEEAARFEALADDFLDEVMKPLENSRGDATTRLGNDIIAQECRKVLEEDFPDIEKRVQHSGGATKDGRGGASHKERHIKNIDDEDSKTGTSRADLSWKYGDEEWHLNTTTMNKGGDLAASERRSFARLAHNVGEGLAHHMPKLRPGMDENEYRELARKRCREIMHDHLDKHVENNSSKEGE